MRQLQPCRLEKGIDPGYCLYTWPQCYPGFKRVKFKYMLALFFGLIHGMGFSNYLKGLLGNSNQIIAELFAFNIGLEFGQLLIVAGTLALSFLLLNLLKVKKWDWNFFLSSAIFGISFVMALERLGAILI